MSILMSGTQKQKSYMCKNKKHTQQAFKNLKISNIKYQKTKSHHSLYNIYIKSQYGKITYKTETKI